MCMRVEAITVQGVDTMKKVPKMTFEKGPSVMSSREEQRGRKWNSSLNSNVDQTEMVPFVRKVDVMYLLVLGN